MQHGCCNRNNSTIPVIKQYSKLYWVINGNNHFTLSEGENVFLKTVNASFYTSIKKSFLKGMSLSKKFKSAHKKRRRFFILQKKRTQNLSVSAFCANELLLVWLSYMFTYNDGHHTATEYSSGDALKMGCAIIMSTMRVPLYTPQISIMHAFNAFDYDAAVFLYDHFIRSNLTLGFHIHLHQPTFKDELTGWLKTMITIILKYANMHTIFFRERARTDSCVQIGMSVYAKSNSQHEPSQMHFALDPI